MSQEVAAKYVNEVTVGGVTRYQACVHGCSSDVRDTHHEAVKDARRMLQSATVTAVMKGDMPKLPAAVADAMNGASPLLASTVVRLKAELEAVAKERDALKSSLKEASECNRIGSERMLKMVEERDAAKRLHRETLGILGKVCGEMLTAAAAAGLSEEKRSGNAVECAKSLVSWVSDAVADGERASKYVARLGLDVGERYTLMMVVRAMVERIDELTAERDGDPQRARAERLAGIGRRLNQEKNDLEAERDAFALTIARLVSKN